MKYAHVYLLDTLADWELGHAVAELNTGQSFRHPGERIPVRTVAATPVTSKGGLRFLPDVTADVVTPENTAVLLLPGADTWDDPRHDRILSKVRPFLDAGVIVAAICGATGALARLGVLNDRAHTSNAPEFLEQVSPAYRGKHLYRTERAVADRGLITAGGTSALDWARTILRELDVVSETTLKPWYELYQTGDPKYFYQLIESLPKPEPSARSADR